METPGNYAGSKRSIMLAGPNDDRPAHTRFGPGLLSVSHGPDDYVDLESLTDFAKIYAQAPLRRLTHPEKCRREFAIVSSTAFAGSLCFCVVPFSQFTGTGRDQIRNFVPHCCGTRLLERIRRMLG